MQLEHPPLMENSEQRAARVQRAQLVDLEVRAWMAGVASRQLELEAMRVEIRRKLAQRASQQHVDH